MDPNGTRAARSIPVWSSAQAPPSPLDRGPEGDDPLPARILLPAPSELSIRNMLDRYTAKYGIILEVLPDKTVVGGPAHLRWFWWNSPVIQVGGTEFSLQFGPADMGPVDRIAELTMVGGPSAPILSAPEK